MSVIGPSITSMSESLVEPVEEPGARAVELRPDASVLDAIGRGHTLASALADIIDNSIDAGASRIGIRLVTRNSEVRAVRIVDDGCGMTAEQLESAMSLGRKKESGEARLGHFGVGMKGASFSQAQILTVITSTGFAPPAAMRLARTQTGAGIMAEAFAPDIAADLLRRRGLADGAGTVIEWTKLEAVSVAVSVQDRRRWVESMILQVRDELGLTFHRLLAARRIRISIDEMDEDSGETGAPRSVAPVDPFAFERWGAVGYPRELPAGDGLTAKFVILPPGVDSTASRMLGRDRRQSQGLYVYRNDRLLHAGGWLELRADAPAELQLARVALDVGEEALDVVVINPEKRGVVLRPAALQALSEAASSGFTLHSFWEEARGVWDASRRREAKAQPVTAPGEGAPAALRAIVEQTVGVRDDGAVEISFAWMMMPEGQLFAFEPASGIVRLNERHREQMEPQLEVMKTGLFYALEGHAGKEWLGKSTVERLNSMQAAFAASIGIGVRAQPPPRPSERAQLVEDPDPDHAVADDAVEIEIFDAIVSDADSDEPLADPRVAHVHVSSDAIDEYMKSVRRTTLLTAEEEVELSKAVEVGLLAGERLDALPAGSSEEADLVYLVRSGGEALTRMIESNLRLVVSIALRYRGNGLDLADLIQEGNAGLIKAVQKFDHQVGTKFSTYATWWIRQAVTRAIADQGRLIRFPVHVVEKMTQISSAWDATTGGATARLEATAAQTSVSVDIVRAVIGGRVPPRSLEKLVHVQNDRGSWSQAPFGDTIVDELEESPFDIAAVAERRQLLDIALADLSEREAQVIRLRYGLDDGEERTLGAIGDAMGVTRERIRQLQNSALKRLPEISAAQALKDHLIDGAHLEIVPERDSSSPGGASPTTTSTSSGEPPAEDTVEVAFALNPDAPEIPHLTAEVLPLVVSTPDSEEKRGSEHKAIEITQQWVSRLTWDQFLRVADLYNAQAPISTIADDVGVEPWIVQHALVRCLFNLESDPAAAARALNRGTGYSDDELDRIHTWMASGWTLEVIAEPLGRTAFAVGCQVLRDLDRRPRLTRRVLSKMRIVLEPEASFESGRRAAPPTRIG